MITNFENEIAKIIVREDIAEKLLELLDKVEIDNEIYLSDEIQNKLITHLLNNKYEEEIWTRLLSVMNVENISEKLIQYCIQREISVITLCHMPLDDKWLFKLINYDDAPLYTLSKRYYLMNKYSDSDFVQFYNQYLFCKQEILQNLLERNRDANRRKLLMFLCLHDERIDDKSQIQYHQVADEIRISLESHVIVNAYEKYRTNGIVLREIADNYYTPSEILNKLSVIKGVSFANEIRRKSKITLQIKNNMNQQTTES